MAKITAMEAYKLLPKTNCKECGEQSCMSFALKLVSRGIELGRCPYITKENLPVIKEKTTPPVKEVTVGFGDSKLKVGGEEVMYRHELKFFSPCGVVIDVSDNMKEDEVEKRIAFAKSFSVERMGEVLRLDGIAVRCSSDEPEKYRNLVRKVAEAYDGALILCSFNPKVIEEGLSIAGERKPLLYAATIKNWEEMMKLAKKYDAPLAVYSQNLDELGTITANLSHDKLILDPGIITAGAGLGETLDRFVMLRRSAIEGVKEASYPLMAAPAAVWHKAEDEVSAATYESIVAGMLMDRYASLLIVHSIEPWSILPLLTLRQCIYTDPRTEPQIKEGLYTTGKPDEKSPVLITTNFSLTYFTVSGDVKKYDIDAYILVINTKGFAVDTAVATGDLSAPKIKEALTEFEVAEKVKHKKIIIPLFASHLRGAIEDETGWEVLVGPRDSSGIQKFLQEKWQT